MLSCVVWRKQTDFSEMPTHCIIRATMESVTISKTSPNFTRTYDATIKKTVIITFRAVFWVVLPCKYIVDRRFRGAYCLHHQKRRATIYLHGSTTQKTALNEIIIVCSDSHTTSDSHATTMNTHEHP